MLVLQWRKYIYSYGTQLILSCNMYVKQVNVPEVPEGTVLCRYLFVT